MGKKNVFFPADLCVGSRGLEHDSGLYAYKYTHSNQVTQQLVNERIIISYDPNLIYTLSSLYKVTKLNVGIEENTVCSTAFCSRRYKQTVVAAQPERRYEWNNKMAKTHWKWIVLNSLIPPRCLLLAYVHRVSY